MTSTGLLAGAFAATLALPFPAAAAARGGEKVLYSFCNQQNCTDGAAPQAGLIDVDGTLYGTTGGGGLDSDCESGCGTVFALDPKTGVERVIYSFCSQQNCTDGEHPFAGLIDVNGTLYGTTVNGGLYSGCEGGCGTVFALDPKTGAEKVLHSFGSGTDGFTPFAALIDVKGTLYGTTEGGGTGCGAEPGCGTAFAIDPKNGAETILYSFCSQQNCTDGSAPETALIDVKGTLYGTTPMGGTNCQGGGGGCGTVFALDPNTGAEKVIYSFCCRDGRFPTAGLIDVTGTLYGTTVWGGRKSDCQYGRGCGTVFALDPSSGAETVLHSFCDQQSCTDGTNPEASLTDVAGTLYGTTLYGGDRACGQEYRRLRCGTVFTLDPNTGAETVLYSFCRQQNCADGELPWGALIDVNGTLYGTTTGGGSNGEGTVFALKEP
jgi:uncharacterized repeat protein (TIGR03803 family)